MKLFIYSLFALLCLAGCRHETDESQLPGQMMVSADGGVLTDNHASARAVGPENVYVCKSSGATRYHYNENCHGLKKCKHQIEKTTVKKAETVGLTLCKHED